MLVVLEVAARLLGIGDPVLYYNDPCGGARPLPSQQVERLKGATVTVDENGYRTSQPEVEDALRILYLGDSVTWGGTSLDDKVLFSEVAAEVMRGKGEAVYAMNAGVNGTALVNQAEIFLNCSDAVDVLVWLFPWTDAYRNYATVGLLMPARFKPRFALVEVVDHLVFRFWVNAFREQQQADDPFIAPNFPTGEEVLFNTVQEGRYAKNLDAFRAVLHEAQRRGIPVVVGVTPYREGNSLVPLPAQAASLLQEVRGVGVQVFDVTYALNHAPSEIEALFVDHVHFSENGHLIIGQALSQVIESARASTVSSAHE